MAVTSKNNMNHTGGKGNDLQDVPLDHDPEIAVEASDYGHESKSVNNRSAETIPVAQTIPYPPPEGEDRSAATGTRGAGTVTNSDALKDAEPPPQFYQQQQQNRKWNNKRCLIAGSIGITAGLVCCICFILPIVVFLIIWSQMNKQYNASIDSGKFGGMGGDHTSNFGGMGGDKYDFHSFHDGNFGN